MLSKKARKALEIACPQGDPSAGYAGTEIANALDNGFAATPAADVAANSAASAITVPDNTQASINAALVSVVSDINADRTQINAILAALKAAGLML